MEDAAHSNDSDDSSDCSDLDSKYVYSVDSNDSENTDMIDSDTDESLEYVLGPATKPLHEIKQREYDGTAFWSTYLFTGHVQFKKYILPETDEIVVPIGWTLKNWKLENFVIKITDWENLYTYDFGCSPGFYAHVNILVFPKYTSYIKIFDCVKHRICHLLNMPHFAIDTQHMRQYFEISDAIDYTKKIIFNGTTHVIENCE